MKTIYVYNIKDGKVVCTQYDDCRLDSDGWYVWGHRAFGFPKEYLNSGTDMRSQECKELVFSTPKTDIEVFKYFAYETNRKCLKLEEEFQIKRQKMSKLFNEYWDKMEELSK